MGDTIRIKVGDIEYEGSREFAENGLLRLVKAIADISRAASVRADDQIDGEDDTEVEKLDLSTESVASKLGVDVRKDLVMAACAQLAFVQGKDTFSRQEILNEMKNATSYYGENDSKNLSDNLSTLVKEDKLVKRGNGEYAIDASRKGGLRDSLTK